MINCLIDCFLKGGSLINEKSRTKKHWLVLGVVSLMFGVFGGVINSSIGVFYSPVSQELGILRGSFALHSTITMVAVGVISLVIPNIIHKFGWKLTITFGTICAVIGTAGMAFTESLSLFYILGAIRGIGAGFFGLVPMSMFINNWFYEKNGLAMSIASGTSGVSGMIFAPMFASIIANFGWRTSFIAMGMVIVLMALPVIFYPYSLKPEEDGLVPYGYKDKKVDSAGKNLSSNGDQPLKSAMASFTAMLLFSVLLTNVLGMNQHLSSYGESIGMSLQLSGYILSAVMFGNVAFKLIIGPLSDRFGPIIATVIMIASNSLGLILLILTKNAYLTIFGSFLFGAVFSVGSVAKPLLTKKFFGRKLSERVFPIITFVASLGAAFSNTMVGYIFDFTGTYVSAFVIGITFQIVNLLMLYLANRYKVNN